ncbi:AAA family ATPase [Thauera propionica]|uniref:AAA family ATPase n=1 Tax=Thauera propionica TaxID=2019431 RepID=UPI0023F22256|nr:SMC family ATPase [Thauera propionica]MDD3673983.1 SMC family ATPase [Thauera propionica]
MKPLKLSLQAFGPFATREEVDFTRLPPGALFLIAGPTGAGKTSILDGITYALYGDTSGGERSAREMRSHHADAALQTEVELEFALGAQRYRVRRVPEQTRAAQRGGGVVNAPAKAELFRLDANGVDWVPLAQRTTEVTALVEDLLGFKADQFRQVVLLPQGQFRKLLAASSAEREKILETLFGTATYKRLQDALKAEAAALRERGEKAALQRQTLLGQAGVDTMDALVARRDALQGQLVTLGDAEQQARAEDTAARAALQHGQAVEAQFAEAAAAAAALQALEAGKAELDAQRLRLEQARRALQVLPADAALASARRSADEARQRETQAARDAAEAVHRLGQAETALQAETARAPEREAAQRELLRLEGLAEAVARLAQAEAEAARSEAARIAADKALAAATATQQTLATRRTTLAARIEALQPLAGNCAALELRLQQAEQRARALAALAAARKQLAGREAEETKARTRHDAAQRAAGEARAKAAALDAGWRQAQAAILAAHLHDGEACPVCGSAAHPSPARHEGELPTEQTLQAAAELAREAETALDAARQALNAAELARATAAAEVATRAAELQPVESQPADGAAPEHPQSVVAEGTPATDAAELRRHLDAARAAALELEPLRAQLQTTDAELANAAIVGEHARTQAAEAASAARAAQHVADERRAGVPDALRTPAALQAGIAQAQDTRQRLERALQQAQSAQGEAASRAAALRAQHATLAEGAQAAQVRVGEAAQQFVGALQAAGFWPGGADEGTVDQGEAAWRAALLSPERITALEAAVRDADDRRAAAHERAGRAAQAVAGLLRPDLAALDARATAARVQVEAVVDRIGQTRSELRTVTDTLARLDEIARESGAIEAEYRVVGHLADIANGNNGRNLTFQRYVLAALLDDVLRAASLRLSAMSRGRYQLQRREDVADARRAAGLDLEVFDEYTGRTRPASTLSGGEGFMASLSLALGLSDVVQAYAGGVQLDTLFIDEGFGSLDPEALDMAMKALIDLQQRGRTVGVISHVEEMKQQIDVAIEVVQGVRGSRVRGPA